jgi:hypothetical protein
MAKITLKKVTVDKVTVFKKAQPAARVVLKKSAFKFIIRPNPVLFRTQLSLTSNDKIDIQAVRNPGLFAKIVTKPQTSASSDSEWNCSSQRWSGEVTSSEPVILNKNMDAIYPGAIFNYESIANGTYKRLPYKRKPITLLINRNQASIANAVVTNPSAASVAQAVSNIVGSKKGGGAAISFGEKFEVMSEEHLFMSTAGSGHYLGFGGSGSFDLTSKSKTHKFYVKLVQEYYSILIDDTNTEPSDFFVTTTENPSEKDALKPELTDPNWVVVSAVKYGRMLNLLFESDESFSEYNIDINAYANYLVAAAELDFSLKQKSFLKRTTVRLAAFGGNPNLTGQVLVAGKMAEIRKAVKNYFTGSFDEVPIAYSLATLDGDNIGVRMMSDFTSRQCAPAASKYEITWKSIFCRKSDDASGDEDISAFMRVRAWDGKGNDILDQGKKNKTIIAVDAANKKTGFKAPVPWTFRKGSEKNPLQLSTGEMREIGQRIVFKVDKKDKNAKLGIRADVVEYDSTSADDHFADDVKDLKFSEVGDSKKLNLVCDHEGSRIEFNVEVRPLYD